MNDNVEIWLWLLLVMGPHNPRTMTALRAGGYDVKRTCVQMREGKCEFIKLDEMERIKSVRLGQVRAVQQLCAKNNISIITIEHPDYPEKLKHIVNPPIVLFVQGDIACLKADGKPRKIITAVGTRKHSPYSFEITSKLCAQFAKSGACVVSGLATGLDTAAHRAVLEAQATGVTVGILACGSLVNYPAENEGLKKQIIQSGGAIISELLPEMPSPRGYFDMRNRLLSGIADCVVVLEASAKSGTLLTAKHAFEQRKRVFFIPPHNIADKRYNGAQILYGQGAVPLFSPNDIISTVTPFSDVSETSEKEKSPTRKKPAQKPETQNVKAGSRTDNPQRLQKPVTQKPDYIRPVPEGMSELETKIYKELLKSSYDSDMLVVRVETNYRDVMDALVNLELDGIVQRNAEGTYSLCE